MKLETQEHNIFNKPSILINIAHSVDISLNSLKVYNYIVRELFKGNIANTTTLTTTFKELANALGFKSNYSTIQMLNYLIELEKCSIRTKTFSYKRNDWKDNLITHLISSITYNEVDNTVKVEISQGLRDLLLKYQETFAKLDLEEIKKIKSKHTLKLYELFKDYSYHQNHKINIDIDNIFDFLNIEKESNYRNDISVFNRDIIKKSINEINKKSYMKIDYKYFRENKNNKAYYTFTIQDITPYSFNKFKEAIIIYIENVNPNIEIIYNKIKYTIEKIENRNKENYMLINAITGKTTETETAKEIWEYLHREMNYNTVNFCEYINIDLEKFDEIYKINKKRTKKELEKIENNNEILIHKNQSTLKDFIDL